jgi:tetratricopeptide (TPR) repeat protein
MGLEGNPMRMLVRCLAVAGLVGAGCGSALVAEGDAAVAAKRYEDAVAKYAAARTAGEGGAEVDGKLAEASKLAAGERRAQAEAAERRGAFDEAIGHWQRAAELQPGEASAGVALDAARGKAAEAASRVGEAARGAGKLDDAVAAYRRALGHRPKERLYAGACSRARAAQGKALADALDVPGAVAAYRDAVAIDADNAEARDQLALHEARLNKVHEHVAAGDKAAAENDQDAAVKAYDAALALWPGHPDAAKKREAVIQDKRFLDHYRTGVSHLESREYEKAIEAFNAAGKLRQTDLLSQKRNVAYREKWTAEGDLHAASKAWEQALEAWDQALRYAEGEAAATQALVDKVKKGTCEKWMALGMRHEVNREWIQACRAYEKLKAEFPDMLGDTELVKRLVSVREKLVEVQCNICRGKGREQKFKFTPDGKQVPAGEGPCSKCDGTGHELRVKAGS